MEFKRHETQAAFQLMRECEDQISTCEMLEERHNRRENEPDEKTAEFKINRIFNLMKLEALRRTVNRLQAKIETQSFDF